jgi:hypothetical protein
VSVARIGPPERGCRSSGSKRLAKISRVSFVTGVPPTPGAAQAAHYIAIVPARRQERRCARSATTSFVTLSPGAPVHQPKCARFGPKHLIVWLLPSCSSGSRRGRIPWLVPLCLEMAEGLDGATIPRGASSVRVLSTWALSRIAGGPSRATTLLGRFSFWADRVRRRRAIWQGELLTLAALKDIDRSRDATERARQKSMPSRARLKSSRKSGSAF